VAVQPALSLWGWELWDSALGQFTGIASFCWVSSFWDTSSFGALPDKLRWLMLHGLHHDHRVEAQISTGMTLSACLGSGHTS